MEILVLWVLSAIIGGAILSRYNAAGTGAVLGLLLGPIGWAIALVIRGSKARKEKEEEQKKLEASMERAFRKALTESRE